MAEKPEKTLAENLLETGLKVALGAAASYSAAEAYARFMTPEHKRAWESRVQMHHGEAGVCIVAAGAAAKSPFAAGVGLGLALHDRKDRKKWFTGDKRKLHSKARLRTRLRAGA